MMFVFIKTFLIGFSNVFFLLSIIIQITVKKKKKTGEYFLRLCLERSHLALILLINEACILEIPMQNFPKRKLLSTKVENKIEPNVQEFSTWINKHDSTVRPQNFDQLQRTITGKNLSFLFFFCAINAVEKKLRRSQVILLTPLFYLAKHPSANRNGSQELFRTHILRLCGIFHTIGSYPRGFLPENKVPYDL